MVIQPLSTRLIKPNFCFDLSHRRSTTVSLETRNSFTTQPLRPRSFLATTTLKLTMPNLKTLIEELRQEIVSYLYPLPSTSSNLAFRLVIHIFSKTRFSSHINFISRWLQHKVLPKGFSSNFHASIFSNVSNFNLKYLHEIQGTQNTFSHNIMRSTIRAMCSKRNELNKQIIECRSQLSNVCPSVLLRSIHAKIQALNSKLFHHLEQTKKHKLENLTNPRKTRTAPLVNLRILCVYSNSWRNHLSPLAISSC